MNGLDERKRDSEVPRSENMIQYAFNKFNQLDEGNPRESIQTALRNYQILNKAVEKYQKENNKEKVNPQTPIVTADDVKREMYRESLER